MATDMETLHASPSAARLPIESKAEKRKRRAEKQQRREEKRRRREEKERRRAQGADVTDDVTQDTTQDVTYDERPQQDEPDEDITHVGQEKRAREESDDLEDAEEEARLAQRSEAKRLKRLKKAQRKQQQKEQDDDAADVSLLTRPPPPASQAQSPPSPQPSQNRNPFAPSSSAPNPNPFSRSSPGLASSPPFYPRGGLPFNSQPLPDHGTRFSSVDPSYASHASSPVAASAVLPYDASDFPPGFDMTALDQDSTTAPSTKRAGTSQPTAAALDAALRSQSATKGTPTAARGRVKTVQVKAHEGIMNSKEGTIADATGLTEKQILSEKLYQPHQIKWLEEAGILTTVHRGKFSKQEDRTLRSAMDTWCRVHSLTQSEAIELIQNRTHDQAQMYADLTSFLAASIEGRSLRSVRRFVLENFHQAKTGSWSEEEVESLRKAYNELGPKWSIIAQRLNRLSRDVRVKHRDYIAVDGRFRATQPTTQQANGESSMAASTSDTTLTSSSDGLKKGKWTQSEMQQLETVVREQCTALSLDIDGPNLPWKAIGATVNRSTQSCIDKWDEIRAKQIKGNDPFETATPDESYFAARDDLTLVRRLLDRQADVLERNDAKLIRWSRVIDGPHDNEADRDTDDRGLPFGRKTTSKAFTRLVTRLKTELASNFPNVNAEEIPLLTLLRNHALPFCETIHNDWVAGTYTRTGSQKGRPWSNERMASTLQANAERRAEREAERAQRAAARLAKREEKERKREEKEVNSRPTRKGTKAGRMNKRRGGDRVNSSNEDDRGDRIGSDEEE